MKRFTSLLFFCLFATFFFAATSAEAQVVTLPTSLTYSQGVGTTSEEKIIQVRNNSLVASAVISSIALSGTDAGLFEIFSNTCPVGGTLPGLRDCIVGVRYTPDDLTADAATLTVNMASGTDPTVTLTGNPFAGPGVNLNPTAIDFLDVGVGATSQAQLVQLTNNGTTNLTVSSVALATGTDFGITTDTCTGSVVAPGGSCLMEVACSPTATGPLSDSLDITSDASTSPDSVTLDCNGVIGQAVNLSTTAIDFGDVAVGATSPAQLVQVTNSGNADLAVTTAALATGTDFVIVTNTCDGATVAPGGSCLVEVACAPTATGALSDSLDITSDATSSPDSVTLDCNGIIGQAVTLSTTAIDFGDVAVSVTSPSQLVQVTNSGTTDLAVTTAALTTGTDFTIVTNTCDGATVAPGGSCLVEVACAPTTTGGLSDSLDITSDATSSPDSVTLDCNGVIGQAVTLTPTALDFGDVGVGVTSPAQLVQLTNSGTTNLAVTTAALVTGTDFTIVTNTCDGATVAPGGSCLVEVACAPTATGLLNDSLDITSDAASSPDSVTLDCNGIIGQAVSLNPTALDFGDVGVGVTSLAQTVQLTNSGTAPLNVTTAALDDGTDFAITSNTCDGAVIAPGGSCLVQVVCKPTTAAALTDFIEITSDADSSPDTVDLDCNGVLDPVAVVNPDALDFGDVGVGHTSVPQAVEVINLGTTDLIVSGATLDDDTDFAISSNTCNSLPLAPGASCIIEVTCTPTDDAALGTTLEIESNDPNTPATVDLDCNGVVGPVAVANPTSLDFGDIGVGNTSTGQIVQFTNSGSTDLTVSSATLDDDTDFEITSNTCDGAVVAPGGSCLVEVACSPTTTGSLSTTLDLESDDPNTPLSVPLDCEGIVGPGVVVMPPSQDFGDVIVGQTSQVHVSQIINTGITNLSITSVTVTSGGSDFTLTSTTCNGAGLPPGGTCIIQAVCNPSGTGSLNGTVEIVSDAPSTPDELQLLCNGIQSSIDTAGSGSFGNVNVGEQGGPNTIILTNDGDADLTIGTLTRIGEDTTQFSISNDECSGQVLTPGDDCSFDAVFSPTAGGSFSDSVLIPNDSGTPSFTFGLTGTGIVPVPPGVGKLQIKTNVLDFDLETSSSDSQSTTITNIGDGPVTINALVLEGDSQFTQVNDCDGQTLAPGVSCTVTATFQSGGASGNFSAVVSVDSDPATTDFLVLLGSAISDEIGGGGCSIGAGASPMSVAWLWLLPALGLGVLRRRIR